MVKSEYDDIKVSLIKKSLEKESTDVCVPVERRKKPDNRLNFINLMSFCVWQIIIIIIAVISEARSLIKVNQYANLLSPLEFWRKDLLNVALILTVCSCLICMISIILNFTRHKRRTDRIKKSLIICQILSFSIGLFLIIKLY